MSASRLLFNLRKTSGLFTIVTSLVVMGDMHETNVIAFLFPTEVVCAPDWHKCIAVCVRFFDVTKTRSEAKNHCEQFRTSAGVKGSLVKIGNQADNRRIVNIRLSTPSIPQGKAKLNS